MNRSSLVNHARVVVVHTVDIGPYLYLFGIDSSTNQRCCIVATATLQIVNLAIGITANESLGDIYLCSFLVLENIREFLTDIRRIGFGILVGAHKVECRQQTRVNALLLHIVLNHVSAHDFSLSHDTLLLEAGEELLGE